MDTVTTTTNHTHHPKQTQPPTSHLTPTITLVQITGPEADRFLHRIILTTDGYGTLVILLLVVVVVVAVVVLILVLTQSLKHDVMRKNCQQ